MGRPRGSGRRPERAFVEAAIAEAARSGGSPVTEIISGRAAKSSHLRRGVWAGILAQTGCSKSGLADVWGCHRQAIQRAMAAKPDEGGLTPQMRALMARQQGLGG